MASSICLWQAEQATENASSAETSLNLVSSWQAWHEQAGQHAGSRASQFGSNPRRKELSHEGMCNWFSLRVPVLSCDILQLPVPHLATLVKG